MKLIRRIARWVLRNHLDDEYIRGWEDGVEQQRHMPETTYHYESYDENGVRWE